MPPYPTPPSGAHRYAYRVAYNETDAMGRVYYANYLIWLERGRVEMLRALGFPYKELETQDLLLPVRQCQLRYLGFATYDDEVTIVTWTGEVRRACLTFLSQVYLPGQERPIVHASVELACVNRAGRPQPFPGDLAAALSATLEP